MSFNASRTRVVADATDRWAQGAERGLMIRAGLVKATDADRGNEFTRLSLPEIARSSLNVRNIAAGRMNPLEMVGAALTVRNAAPGMHSTSDFPSVLASVARKAVLKGYNEVDETFPLWTSKGTVSDFRGTTRAGLGLFPTLDQIKDGSEYKFGTMSDTGTTIAIATYGKKFAISRQAIINDDLSFISKVPQLMGRSAKRTLGYLVYAILTVNPTMQDGVVLFSTIHGNRASAGTAITTASLSAARAAMARQKDDQGNGVIGNDPAFIIVAPEYRDIATTVLQSENIAGDAGLIPNPVRGMVTVISDSRLTGPGWYLASNPNEVDTIEVTYLAGQEEPFLDQKDGWDVDGTEFKVRLDAGAKALHWQGLYFNPGA